MYWDLISVTRLSACSACALDSLVLQPSIGWPVHMQALTLFVFYINPSTKQKQCTVLASKRNNRTQGKALRVRGNGDWSNFRSIRRGNCNWFSHPARLADKQATENMWTGHECLAIPLPHIWILLLKKSGIWMDEQWAGISVQSPCQSREMRKDKVGKCYEWDNRWNTGTLVKRGRDSRNK